MKIPINKWLAIVWVVMFVEVELAGQPRKDFIQVIVSPDHADWTYKAGENVQFKLTAMKDGVPIQGISIKYDIKPEKMASTKTGTLNLSGDFISVNAGTMNVPGFLRCWASVDYNGKTYTGYATAGFDPTRITPATKEPADFTQFWIDAKEELSSIPVDARMTLLPERSNGKVNVYHVEINTWPEGAKVYGILSVPTQTGRKFPAILRVPGAGIRPYWGDIETSEKGVITLEIGIHGIPVNMERYVYDNLMRGGLKDYWVANMDNRDQYYYKRVYLSCVRAVDYIFSLSAFDGDRLAVVGGSQGGALSIVTAGLDNRIKYLVPYFPALCDLTGYLSGRAGGWPHMFSNVDISDPVTKAKVKTAGYYDVVNFARYVQAPGIYSWGYNDDVCPPTSMYAAYNVIEAPKELYIAAETGHWTFPEQHDVTDKWLFKKFGLDNKR